MALKILDTTRAGAPHGEDDLESLEHAFVEVTAYRQLVGQDGPGRLVVGPAGSGKSALLAMLSALPGSTAIPASLFAASPLAGSYLVEKLAARGVRLDPLFDLLVRHVLSVEVLRQHLRIDSEEAYLAFGSKLEQARAWDFRFPQVITLLDTWGPSIWLPAKERIAEVSLMLGRHLKALSRPSEGEDENALRLRLEGEVRKVVGPTLLHLTDLVARLIERGTGRVHVTVDSADALPHGLTSALVRATRDLSRRPPPTGGRALRTPTLAALFRTDKSVDPKALEPLLVPVRFSREETEKVLSLRLALVAKADAGSLLPKLVDGRPVVPWILDRTRQRPGDVVDLLNEALARSVGRPAITPAARLAAETAASAARLRSAAEEWAPEAPDLATHAALLQGRPPSFRASELPEAGRDAAVRGLYRAGVVGLRVPPKSSDTADAADPLASDVPKLTAKTEIVVAPAFRAGLGVVGEASEEVWARRSKGARSFLRTALPFVVLFGGAAVLLVLGQRKERESAATARLPKFEVWNVSRRADGPTRLAVGSDRVWFTERTAGTIGQMLIRSPFTVTHTPLAHPGSDPQGIAVSPKGTVFFTEEVGNRIGRLESDTPGKVVEVDVPLDGCGKLPAAGRPVASCGPYAIAVAAGGDVWFSQLTARQLGRFAPDRPANVTKVSIPLPEIKSAFAYYTHELAVASDGAVWVTAPSHRRLTRIEPDSLRTTDLELGKGLEAIVSDVLPGRDGKVWLSLPRASALIRVLPTLERTAFPLPIPVAPALPAAMATDGTIWFAPQLGRSVVGRFECEPPYSIDVYPLPAELKRITALAPAPDGTLWFLDAETGKLGHLIPPK